MNQIDIFKSHVIITYSGVHHFITQGQESKLRGIALDGEVELAGNIVKMKNIADILTIEKYYEAFPKKREERIVPSYKDFTGLGFRGIISAAKCQQHIAEMMKGLGGYIDSKRYQGNKEPLELLETMGRKYKSYKLE